MQRDLVRQGYDQMARSYMAEREQLKSGKYVQKLLKLLPRKASVLDVGCGAGIPIDDLIIKAGHEVVGIDISPKMVELAKRNCPEGSYLVGDMLDLKKGEYLVDAVVSFYAIFHIPRDKHEQMLKVLVSLVKPGGYLLLTMGERDFEGEHMLYGVKMWSSHWGVARNRKMLEKQGVEIVINEIDRSGRESHQVLLLRKTEKSY